jgi:hypothetical protein
MIKHAKVKCTTKYVIFWFLDFFTEHVFRSVADQMCSAEYSLGNAALADTVACLSTSFRR